MRAVIYARYSTDLQSASSIDDQVHLCRERLEHDGHELAKVYSDRAVSGAISFMRRRSTVSVVTRRMQPLSSSV